MQPTIKSVQVSTDVRLTYAEQGDPNGMPVICLHGMTDSWRSFESVLPYLPAGMRALALTTAAGIMSCRKPTFRSASIY